MLRTYLTDEAAWIALLLERLTLAEGVRRAELGALARRLLEQQACIVETVLHPAVRRGDEGVAAGLMRHHLAILRHCAAMASTPEALREVATAHAAWRDWLDGALQMLPVFRGTEAARLWEQVRAVRSRLAEPARIAPRGRPAAA